MIYPGIVICKNWLGEKYDDEKNLQIEIKKLNPEYENIYRKVFTKYYHKWQNDNSKDVNIFQQKWFHTGFLVTINGASRV